MSETEVTPWSREAKTCRAIGCLTPVIRTAIFCGLHWSYLPEEIRAEGWQFWKNANEQDAESMRIGYEDWARRCVLWLRNSEEKTEFFLEG